MKSLNYQVVLSQENINPDILSKKAINPIISTLKGINYPIILSLLFWVVLSIVLFS